MGYLLLAVLSLAVGGVIAFYGIALYLQFGGQESYAYGIIAGSGTSLMSLGIALCLLYKNSR